MSLLYLALVSTGAGVFWWRHLRHRPRRLAAPPFDEDAGVAMHVARREALVRDQAPGAVHVLYGLLQVEPITAAVRSAGGDPDALESRVLDELAADPRDGVGDELRRVLGTALAAATAGGRPVSCTDLWAGLRGARVEAVMTASGVDRRATLYLLVHGLHELEPRAASGRACLVLHDDPYTTQAFVTEALTRGCDLDEPTATEIMRAAHTTGRAELPPVASARACAQVDAVRALARAQGYPLRVELEPR